jgi:hypothetical protein
MRHAGGAAEQAAEKRIKQVTHALLDQVSTTYGAIFD